MTFDDPRTGSYGPPSFGDTTPPQGAWADVPVLADHEIERDAAGETILSFVDEARAERQASALGGYVERVGVAYRVVVG